MSTNYSPAIVTDGAVFVGDALMPSTATSATKLYNRAGSSDGTMYNGACCDFDGTDDDIHTTNDITISKACTVSVWISSDTSTQHIFSNKSGGPVNLRFGMDSGKMTYQYYSAAWRYLYSTSTIPLTTWTHLTWVRTADNFISFYINGVLDAGPTQALGSDGSASSSTVNGPVNIVGGYWSSSVFNGRMSDFKVFNTALSSAQVKQMYDDSKVIIPAGSQLSSLDLWYSMAEGTGAIAYDGSGNKNSGVGQNFNNDEFLSGQTGAPQLVGGYNRPMLFDGSSDYVSIADSASLSVGTTFTISYWFYPEAITTEAYHVSKNTYSGNQKSYAALNNSSGKTQFRISGDGSSHIECTGSTTMSNKTWHHIVHVFDGSAGTKLKGWVDGTAQTFNQQPNVTGPYDSTSILCLGTRDAGLVTPLEGIINEVIIYNSALSDANATALFATGPNGGPLPPDPLSMSTSGNIVGYWRNDSNVTLTDLSGNSNTGTAVGSPSALLFKEGYNGQKNVNTGRDNQGFPLKHKNVGAIGFVSDSYVTVPSLGTSGEFSNCTISIWFNKQNQIDTYGNLFDCNFDITDYNKGPRMEIAADNSVIRLYLAADNGNYYAAPAGTFSNDIWTNIAWKITTIGTSKQIVTPYINGVNSYAATEQTDSAYFWDGDIGALNIGRGFSSARTFTGDIGNFRIYDRGLSAAEILQNYNAQKSRFT